LQDQNKSGFENLLDQNKTIENCLAEITWQIQLLHKIEVRSLLLFT